MTAAELAKAQRSVLDWFAAEGRSFSWRRTRDPYRTLVAEVMLQQTQTGRVGPIYEEFLDRFPTISSLAHAPAADVIRAWRGLGYNRRAVGLQQAAQAIVREFDGVVPPDPRTLQSLPGIGEYTANAVACFAFDASVPVVDVNVKRVVARAALGREVSLVAPDRLAKTIATWLPLRDAYDWNQALMDIGATLCRGQKPLCKSCPLRKTCAWRARGHQAPRPAPKRKERFEGSRRQARGRVVDQLRRAAKRGITVKELFARLHPAGDGDAYEMTGILVRLEEEGLVRLSPSARRGAPRGIVRLPD